MSWRIAPLRKICRIVGGSTPNSGFQRYWGGDIVWITPTDLGRNNGMFIRSSERSITREGYDSCGAEFVPEGTVVMSSRAPIGHLAIAQVELCTNQGCKSFVPSDEIDSAFLYFALRNAMLAIRKLGSGATFDEVSKSQLEEFEISLPDLKVQQRIAAILNEQMAVVEKARAAAEERCDMTSLLPEAFLRNRFESPELKSGPSKHLPEFCQILSGGTPNKERSEYWGGRIPWVTVKDMKVRVLDSASLSITERAVEESAVKVAPTGAVLVLVRGMGLAKGLPIVEIRRPCAFNQDIKALVSKGELTPSFLAWSLRYKASKILSERQTVTHGTLKLDTDILEQLSIPAPSMNIQKKVVDQLEHDFAAVDLTKSHTSDALFELNMLPSVLLRRAFSGEL